MNKKILIQYCEIKAEIKDIRRRISQSEKNISSLECSQREAALKRYRQKLVALETELTELMEQTEEYIEAIEKSDLRTMFRLYYIDGYSWIKVAFRMNQLFPRKRIPYSEDSCRMRNNRFFEGI